MLRDRGLLRREGGSWRLDGTDVDVPETVQGIIAARLDALEPARSRCCRLQPSSARSSGSERSPRSRRSRPGRPRSGSTRSSARSSYAVTVAPRWRARSSTRCAMCSCATSRTARSRAATVPISMFAQPQWIESLGADRTEDRAEMLAHHYVAALELTRAAGATRQRSRPGAAGARARRARRPLRSSALESAASLYGQGARSLAEDDPGYPRPAVRARERAVVDAERRSDRSYEEAARRLLAAGTSKRPPRRRQSLVICCWVGGAQQKARRVPSSEPSSSSQGCRRRVRRCVSVRTALACVSCSRDEHSAARGGPAASSP